MHIGNFVKITYIKMYVLSLYTVLRAINTHTHPKINFSLCKRCRFQKYLCTIYHEKTLFWEDINYLYNIKLRCIS